MFKAIKLGADVGVQCSVVNKKLSTCKFSCPEGTNLEGLTMSKCKGKKHLPKKGAVSCVKPLDPSISTLCGDITTKFSFINGAVPNCDGGRFCRPQCPEGQKSGSNIKNHFKSFKLKLKPFMLINSYLTP